MKQVDKCICYNISFEKLKQIAKDTGSSTTKELKGHIEFGKGCQMCNPYVAAMLESGETSLIFLSLNNRRVRIKR